MAGRHSRPFSTKPGHSASSRRVETKTERGLVPLSRAQTAPGGLSQRWFGFILPGSVGTQGCTFTVRPGLHQDTVAETVGT